MQCEHCFDKARAFQRVAAVLQDSHKIREAMVRHAESTEHVSAMKRLLQFMWPKAPILLRPALLLAIILVMAYPTFRGLISTTDHPEEVRPVQLIRLGSTRSTQTDAFSIGSERDGIVSFPISCASVGSEYLATIVTDDSVEVTHHTDTCSAEGIGRTELLLPLAEMTPGDYRLIVSNPGDTLSQVQEYRFRVKE